MPDKKGWQCCLCPIKKVDNDGFMPDKMINVSTDNCIIVPRKCSSEDQQGVILGVAREAGFQTKRFFLILKCGAKNE